MLDCVLSIVVHESMAIKTNVPEMDKHSKNVQLVFCKVNECITFASVSLSVRNVKILIFTARISKDSITA